MPPDARAVLEDTVATITIVKIRVRSLFFIFSPPNILIISTFEQYHTYIIIGNIKLVDKKMGEGLCSPK